MSTTLPSALVGRVFRELAKSDNPRALRELKKVNPKDRFVIVYPNRRRRLDPKIIHEVAQSVVAKRVYSEASDVIGRDVLASCIQDNRHQTSPDNGNQDAPTTSLNFEDQHVNTFVTSHAVMAKLFAERPVVREFGKAAGGIGVGVVNALVLSGAMSFEDGVDLVWRQGVALDRAAPIVKSGRLRIWMAPATRKDLIVGSAVENCLKIGIPPEIAVCEITKRLGWQQIEVAGHLSAIEYLEEHGSRLFNFKHMARIRAEPYACHTRLMQPAHDFIEKYMSDKFRQNSNYIQEPQTCSVYSATSGGRLQTVKSITKDLALYPVRGLNIERLIGRLFDRSKKVPQPNVVIPWDYHLYNLIFRLNRKAGDSTRVVPNLKAPLKRRWKPSDVLPDLPEVSAEA